VITWGVRAAVSLVVTFMVLYFVFMVKLGERTLAQHILRIAQTDEAQDLGDEVGEAGGRLKDEIIEVARDAGIAPPVP
jgi:hypothetical protein